MRRYLKEPIPEISSVCSALSEAVDAHLLGDYEQASARFREANSQVVWDWLNTAWTNVAQHVVSLKPAEDTHVIPREARDPDRNISKHVRRAVLERDGYRCRYCGLPVVHADVRKLANRLYPEAVPWNPRDAKFQHAGFQVHWLQFDHVEPHSHGGQSTIENVVVSCALCNFGKDRFTLRQLDLEDPRLRPPVPAEFDGLERFRLLENTKQISKTPRRKLETSSAPAISDEDQTAFFFPGAWIGGKYVNIPPIQGKSRWFKLEGKVSAEAVVRDGVEGCVVVCPRHFIERRGLDPDILVDTEGAT